MALIGDADLGGRAAPVRPDGQPLALRHVLEDEQLRIGEIGNMDVGAVALRDQSASFGAVQWRLLQAILLNRAVRGQRDVTAQRLQLIVGFVEEMGCSRAGRSLHIGARDGQRLGRVAQQLHALPTLSLLGIGEWFECALYAEKFDCNKRALLMLQLILSRLLALALQVRKVDAVEDA